MAELNKGTVCNLLTADPKTIRHHRSGNGSSDCPLSEPLYSEPMLSLAAALCSVHYHIIYKGSMRGATSHTPFLWRDNSIPMMRGQPLQAIQLKPLTVICKFFSQYLNE